MSPGSLSWYLRGDADEFQELRRNQFGLTPGCNLAQGSNSDAVRLAEYSRTIAATAFCKTVNSPKKEFCWNVRRRPRLARSNVFVNETSVLSKKV